MAKKEAAAQKPKGNTQQEGKASGAQAENAQGTPKPGLSQRDRDALFALLAIAALGAAAYALFLSGQPDAPSPDGHEFYSLLIASQGATILYDVRGVEDDAQNSRIYQCGVDIISSGIFAGKSLYVIGCSEEGCLSMSGGSNGSNRMGIDQAKKEASSAPYILIKPGKSGYAFYQRHMEIMIASNLTEWTGCKITATEG
jgi:hypothetical protein